MSQWLDKVAAFHEDQLSPEEKVAYEHELLDNPALQKAHESWVLTNDFLKYVAEENTSSVHSPSQFTRYWLAALLFASFIAAGAFYFTFLRSYPTPKLELYKYEGIEVIDLQSIPQAMVTPNSDDIILGKVSVREIQSNNDNTPSNHPITKETLIAEKDVAISGIVHEGERLIVMATKSISFKPGFSAGPGSQLSASIQTELMN